MREMSSISTLELLGRINRCGRDGGTKQISAEKLLKRINSSCSSGREEKECKWDAETIMTAASQGNLEMVKYCVANECPINEKACAWAARCGRLECLKYLREEVKAPWDSWTAA